MTEAITLLTLGGIAFLLTSWPRLTSKSRIVRRIYRHVDEQLGATRFENNRRASRRRLLAFFSRDLANLVYPVTHSAAPVFAEPGPGPWLGRLLGNTRSTVLQAIGTGCTTSGSTTRSTSSWIRHHAR